MVKILVLLLLAPMAAFSQHVTEDRGAAADPLKLGTTFVNVYYVTDSADALVQNSAVDADVPGDDTQVVVRTGAHLYGRQDCTVLTGPNHGDSNVYFFAKNGDLYLLNTNHPGKWEYLPFGLKQGKVMKTDPVLDTGTALGHHYEMMDHRELSVIGHEKVTLDGKNYDCIKLLLVEVKVFEGKEYRNGTTYWYSPDIRYFIRAKFGWGGKYFLNQKIAVYKPKQG